MIFLVHSLYFVFKFALKFYKKHKAIREFRKNTEDRLIEEANKNAKADIEENLIFDPPVYRQRYAVVQQVILDHRWRKDIKKIVDFGCAEINFFPYLKHLYGVTEILEVDVDKNLLSEYRFKLQPLTADFLKQRSEPLVIRILCGSISDPDYRLENVDAVVAIEIIEHLYPDTLDAIPYNIFGYIKPRLVIFTTPNADFNILFPNFKGFRHDDHKFEWTRDQFEDWALNVTKRFPEYSVHFEGIGKGPKGTESLGSCSQMAVFTKEFNPIHIEIPISVKDYTNNVNLGIESFGVCTYYSYSKHLSSFSFEQNATNCNKANTFYKLIDEITYPYVEDTRSATQKILHEAMYNIYRRANVNSRYYNEETCLVEIPLHEVISNFDGHYVTEKEIRKILEEAEFNIEECVINGSNETSLCVVYDINMEGGSSKATSDLDRSEHEFEHNINSSNASESEWEHDYEVQKHKKCEVVTDINSSPVSNAEASDLLFDSGYQKSISNAEWSPQSPIIDGVFEDQFLSYLKLDVNDIKDNLKANKLGELHLKQLNNKVFSEKKNFAGSSKKSPIKEALPGTSDSKKRRKSKKSESDDESAKEEVKNITTCIVYNSLNKLNIEDEIVHVDQIVLPVIQADLEGPFVVENGDLANNNRDNEGNNYPDEVAAPEPFVINDEDNANENRDVADNNPEVDPPNRDQNPPDPDQENRNNLPNEANAQNHVVQLVEYVVENVEEAAHGTVMTEDVTLNHASREALFDPDSQLDMLEEYALPDPPSNVSNASNEPLLVGVLLNPQENDDVIPENNPFPNWLLQLFGQPADDDENHDEPHFYCQGDGLGVHPSIIDVDVEDTSSDSSSNDDAQAEHTLSEDDVGSLPVDINNSDPVALEVIGHSVDITYSLHTTQSAVSNDSTDEFFDTVDDSAGNDEKADKK